MRNPYRHLAGGCWPRWRPTRRGSGSRWSPPPAPTRRRSLFADESFDLVFGHAVLHHLPELECCSRSSTACCGPAVPGSSPASPRARATRIAAVSQARGVADLAPPWRAALLGCPRRPHLNGHPMAPTARRPPPGGAGRRARVRARPTSSALPPAAGFGRGARARRGAAGQLVRLVQPHARGQRGPRRGSRCPGGSTTRTAATSLLQGVDRRPARGPPAAAALLQLDARGCPSPNRAKP